MLLYCDPGWVFCIIGIALLFESYKKDSLVIDSANFKKMKFLMNKGYHYESSAHSVYPR